MLKNVFILKKIHVILPDPLKKYTRMIGQFDVHITDQTRNIEFPYWESKIVQSFDIDFFFLVTRA